MSTVDDICGAYTLSHWDGKVTPTKASLTIYRKAESTVVHIIVGNNLRGKVHCHNYHIKGSLRSTSEEVHSNQEELEKTLTKGFSDGFNVVKEANRLLLKNAHNSFAFVLSRKLSDLFGEHAIIAINNQPPTQEMSMTFTANGEGGGFVIANIANSLRGSCQIDAGVLRGDLATTDAEPNEALAEIEKMICEGFRIGFNVEADEFGHVLQTPAIALQLCRVVTLKELEGEYLLKKFDGKDVNTSNQVSLNFKANDTDEVEISISVANRIRGKATLVENVLTSEEPLMSTRASASDEEAQLEGAFNVGFQYGLEVIARGNELKLKNQDCEFVLVKSAVVEAQQTGATYKGTQCSKCFKTEGNGLLFRIVNEHEKKWAFYNDTEKYRVQVHAKFGARSQIEALNNAKMTRDDEGCYIVEVTVEPRTTEMFIEGDVNGFKLMYTALTA